MSVTPGTKVVINTPDNPRLHKSVGVVDAVEAWGAYVLTPAAATGRFRALHSEMQIVTYTGDACDTCGSVRLRRAGSCLVCEDCGSNSGCG